MNKLSKRATSIIILGIVAVFLFIMLFPAKQYGFTKDIQQLSEKYDLPQEFFNFKISLPSFYVYSESLSGRKLIRIYGQLNQEDVDHVISQKNFTCTRESNIRQPIFIDKHVPANFLNDIKILRDPTHETAGLLVGTIIDCSHNDISNMVRMYILVENGTFVFTYQNNLR